MFARLATAAEFMSTSADEADADAVVKEATPMPTASISLGDASSKTAWMSKSSGRDPMSGSLMFAMLELAVGEWVSVPCWDWS